MYAKDTEVLWHKKGLDKPLIAKVHNATPNEKGEIQITYGTISPQWNDNGQLLSNPAFNVAWVSPDELSLIK